MQALRGLVVSVAGCVDITTEVQPINPNVKPALFGEDCTMVLLGFGVGHNSFQHAMANGRPIDTQEDLNYSGPLLEIIAAFMVEQFLAELDSESSKQEEQAPRTFLTSNYLV